jgi:hypothetical protein
VDRPGLLTLGLFAGSLVLAGAALASDNPVADVASGIVEKHTLEYLADVVGVEWVAAYKAIDVIREVGEAGVDAQDHTLEAELVAVDRDIEVLKTLKAHGINLRSDPIANAAKFHLKAEQERMSADGLSSSDFIIMSVLQNPDYAVAKAGWTHLLEEGIARHLERFKWLPYGHILAKSIAAPLADTTWELNDHGWTRLSERVRRAEPYVDRYRKAAGLGRPPGETARNAVDLVLNQDQADAFQRAFDEALSHSAPGDPGVRRALVLASLPAAAAALPVPAPPLPNPQPTAPAARPQPLALPPQPPHRANYFADPMYLSVAAEDRLERTPRAEPAETPPRRPDPEPEPAPSFLDQHPDLKELEDCIGPPRSGCEKYNSSSGGDDSVNYQGNFRATPNQ